MPYYKCLNKECVDYNEEKLESKVSVYYDKDMNKIDSGEECPSCKSKRIPIDTPMPENVSFRGVMKYDF